MNINLFCREFTFSGGKHSTTSPRISCISESEIEYPMNTIGYHQFLTYVLYALVEKILPTASPSKRKNSNKSGGIILRK